MIKRYLFILGLVGSFANGYCQPATGPLNPTQLGEKKWIYSMDSAMADPENVYKLSLASMKLKEIPAEVFTFTNLQILTLSQNKIKRIPADIQNLKNLEMLSLFKNKIKSVPLEMKELNNLKTLYLGRNKLTQLPVWVGGMGHLRRLDLIRNRLTPLEVQNIHNLLPKVELTF